MTSENRQVTVFRLAMALSFMMMLLAVTGVAQCAEHGAIRFSAGQAGGDLSAYLISLYCADGSGNTSYITLLTEWDEGSKLSGTERGSSVVAAAQGTLTLVEGGGATTQDRREAVAEYGGEMQLRGGLRLAP